MVNSIPFEASSGSFGSAEEEEGESEKRLVSVRLDVFRGEESGSLRLTNRLRMSTQEPAHAEPGDRFHLGFHRNLPLLLALLLLLQNGQEWLGPVVFYGAPLLHL
jgi:hypothetical protein